MVLVSVNTGTAHVRAARWPGAALFALLAILGGGPARAQEQAWMADRFVDSVGVNTHLFKAVSVPGNSYGDYAGLVKPMLTGLGVRHIRDEMAVDNPGGNYWSHLTDLAASGVKSDLIIEPAYSTVDQALAVTKQNLLGAQECVEGPNELDGWPGYGSSWMPTDSAYTQQIKAKYGGDPATAGMPIIGFSLIAAPTTDTNNYVKAYGNYSASVSYGNCHPYTYSYASPESAMPGLISGCAPLWGGAPYVNTETGYYTGSSPFSVSPIVQGKYTLRSLFAAFNGQAYRTYLYELLDESSNATDSEMNYGLVTAGGSAKPAYKSLKNLIALLSDPGGAFTTGSLTWSITGQPSNFRYTLMQKRDGAFYLAVWNAIASGDATVSQTATLTVPSIRGATEYTLDPSGNISSRPLTLSRGHCAVTITDSVSVVRLSK